ncbi:hypothetical protein HII31_08333 [Pseudocercospora fuligena]|uniref:Uncharacterized protein n=1 Tax=Pseudocercospora fuligena TaxID=685502 RepID=A0A8H6VGT8_9PEZI|nr:hypothetical protein HII31_08333 [Pseudocercospora fuligena]
MHFSTAAIIAALVANVFASPIPQIGGEAQFCQNVVNGATNGVGQATNAALTNTATTIPKTTKLRLRMYRRQGTGAADACYDVVNNVDQGTGYTVGNVLDGAAGDEGAECTDNCAVGNTGGGAASSPPPPPNRRRQLKDIANGVQAVAGATPLGGATAPVTGGIADAANAIDGQEESIGAELGTVESAGTADTGAQVGNAIGSALHGGSAKRQLNKIAAGEQNFADSIGLGAEAEPLTNAEDEIDSVGTSGVGNLGGTIGNTIQGGLVQAGSAVP